MFYFQKKYPHADRYIVNLYGSLAATGRGHLTLETIENTLKPVEVQINTFSEIFLPYHPNGMLFEAYEKGEKLGEWKVYSVGGGDIREDGSEENIVEEEIPYANDNVYKETTMEEIMKWCKERGCSLWEYIDMNENEGYMNYIKKVWEVMREGVERGIAAEGILPGGLKLQRKAAQYHIKARGYSRPMRNRGFMFAYALATAEENASGGIIVTAPTCGSAAVLPAVLYHCQQNYDFNESRILRGLAIAGLIANIVRTNASISGAEVGCQGEIGVACAMAAAAANYIFGGTMYQIEYAAEMGLEHHLGLTCDPMCGLVQIPCIERCAFATVRAFDANIYSMLSDGRHHVSFDQVVRVMKQTGHDLPSLYKETGQGGLAFLMR